MEVHFVLGSCFAFLGILLSLALQRFAHIPLLHTIWFSVPTCLVVGTMAWRRLERWLEARAQKTLALAIAVLQTRQAPGIGELKQLRDYWKCEIEAPDANGASTSFDVTVFCKDEPTAPQLGLIRELKERFRELQPVFLERLKVFLECETVEEVVVQIDVGKLSFEIHDGDEGLELQAVYPASDESDMLYILCLKDWRVVEVYGAD